MDLPPAPEGIPPDLWRRAYAGGRELIGLAGSMTVTPIIGSPPPAPYNAACGILIQHDSRIALVTADHVIKK